MHDSKGQHIGKAPSLHLFHTTADAMLLDHISLVPEPASGRSKFMEVQSHIIDLTHCTREATLVAQ